MSEISKILEVPIANVSKFVGHTMVAGDKVFNIDVPTGEDVQFLETWAGMAEDTQYSTSSNFATDNDTWYINNGSSGHRYVVKAAGTYPRLYSDDEDYVQLRSEAGDVVNDATHNKIYFKLIPRVAGAGNFEINMRNGTATATIMFAVNLHTTSGTNYIQVNDDTQVGGLWSVDSEVKIEIVADWTAHTFDVFVDGTLRFNDIAFYIQGTNSNVNHIRIQLIYHDGTSCEVKEVKCYG